MGYVPNALHTACVIIFGVSFLIHASVVVFYIEPAEQTKIVLITAGIAFASLILVPTDSMWFWGMECVGFTGMILFTPMELWYFKKSQVRKKRRLGGANGEGQPLVIRASVA